MHRADVPERFKYAHYTQCSRKRGSLSQEIHVYKHKSPDTLIHKQHSYHIAPNLLGIAYTETEGRVVASMQS